MFIDTSFPLYLTGSRFFGNVHATSDWDFYCSVLTKEQEEELHSLGFTQEEKLPSQLFGGVIKVFSRSDDVHILVVTDVKTRQAVQETVLHYFPKGYTNKDANAKAIWNMASCIVDLQSN